MITRCPVCQTAFRVTEMQLSARDGRVRCGACAHVFDARAHLHASTPAVPGIPTTESMQPNDAAPMVWPESDSVPDSMAEPAPALTQVKRVAADAPAAVRSASASELSFGPEPAPVNRGRWVAGTLVLLAALAVQGIFYFRSDIALLAPESKPLLKEACAVLGCAILLPQRSELMTIEASDLQADAANPGVVILTATLRNRAAFSQALPALELTLTDNQDLPLARRVLQARDYLETVPDSENGLAAGAERAIRVTLQLTDIKATGYRLYLFYP